MDSNFKYFHFEDIFFTSRLKGLKVSLVPKDVISCTRSLLYLAAYGGLDGRKRVFGNTYVIFRNKSRGSSFIEASSELFCVVSFPSPE